MKCNKYLFRLILMFLGIFLVLPSQSQANVFVAKNLEKFIPTEKFSLVPAELDKRKIISRNTQGVSGKIVLSFREEDKVYGFSAVVCDEKNAILYETRKPASCLRKVINQPSDRVITRFSGNSDYYVFIVNKTNPLRVTRNITMTGKASISVNEKIKARLEAQADLFNQKFLGFFGIEPWNIAIVPCEQRYISSSLENRTLTACSEFILNDTIVPDEGLIINTLSYELTPILEEKWNLDQIRGEADRIEFSAMIAMVLTNSLDPYKGYVDNFENTSEFEKITQQYSEESRKLEYTDRVNTLINIFNDPFINMDKWLYLAYENMTQEILENIRDGKYRHFGFHMNTARIVLKRRHEQQLQAETVPEEEENIISDFW